MTQDAAGHSRRIVEQFTRQAGPFRQMPIHSDREAFELVLQACELSSDDRVLDVACGPGLTACAFAAMAAEVTGIDLTPAMIDQARALQHEKGLGNLSWTVGDVTALPYADETFTLVFSRYAFHHMLDPGTVLREMARVAAPGGRVVVVDVYTRSPEQAGRYDHVERLRDPSHVRALGLDELAGLFERAGLTGISTGFYNLEVDLDALLGSSFPDPGAAGEIQRIFVDDIGRDLLGVGARRSDGVIRFAFPIAILAARQAGSCSARRGQASDEQIE